MFTITQQRRLLQLARTGIEAAVRHGKPKMLEEADPVLREVLGVFVTLTKAGNLRGCIGFPEPRYPLHEAVVHAGCAAALEDPRFPAVTPAELAELHLEISVLSPLVPATPEAVEVGTHGLVIEQGFRRGLLLPQVPVEWGWDRDTFLAHTCRKAGLPIDAWRTGATLYTFTAFVFNDEVLAAETALE